MLQIQIYILHAVQIMVMYFESGKRTFRYIATQSTVRNHFTSCRVLVPVSSIICINTGDDITEEEIDDMIAETDTDGSGTVDYEGNNCDCFTVSNHILFNSCDLGKTILKMASTKKQ